MPRCGIINSVNEAFGKQNFNVAEWIDEFSNEKFIRDTHEFFQGFGGEVTHEDAFLLPPADFIDSSQFEV